MKILFITLRSDHGGGPKHIDLLLENLSFDFEIFIACPQDKPYYEKWQRMFKIKDMFILPHRKFDLKKFFILYKFVKTNKIVLIHSHGKGAGIYSRLLKILYPQVKIVHTLHGLHIDQYSYFKKKMYILTEKILSKFTDKFINVSNGERLVCLNLNLYPFYKSNVVYNGIYPLTKEFSAKDKLELSNKTVISTITRFDYAKNMLLAYEIANKFRDNKSIIFVWIGDGDDKEILERISKQKKLNILFVGFTDQIPLYLSATDIYLSTSRWEGMPYALIESQSLGIPIIATDVIGNNEVVVDGKNGFLFKDRHTAYDCINILIKDKIIYSDFSEDAIRNFYEKFYIGIMVKKIEDIYKNLEI
ncbi:glycosyltransferase [Campylobacter sp. MOP51]|uniref:glycosyltransferase n=1 Tax=Campylobacter canis TaxID=3378588 RepID=UPI003C6549B6